MKRRPLPLSRRFDILKRDNFTCRYCGAYGEGVRLEVDHVIPVANRGPSTSDNLVTACFECNRGKRNKSLLPLPAAIPSAVQQQIDVIWKALMGSLPLSAENARSIRCFINAHGIEETRRALGVTEAKGLTYEDRWRYFCGVNWRWIKAGIAIPEKVIPKRPQFNHRKSSAYNRMNPPLET